MTAKKQKVVVYARVSTNDQNLETQLLAVQNYCDAQGWEIQEIYSDAGISGGQDSRPALDRLKADCSKGKVQVVVVYRLDRLARSVQHLLSCLELFRKSEVGFVSVSESVDTTTPVGRMVTTFLAAIAEFEKSLIQERVIAGVRRAQAEGKHCGRPRRGLDLGLALKLHREGRSVRDIAREVHVGHSTVFRYLRAATATA